MRGEADTKETVLELGGQQGDSELEGCATGHHARGVVVCGELDAIKGGEKRRLAGIRRSDGGVVVGEGDGGDNGKVPGKEVTMRVKELEAEHELAAARCLAA